MTVQLVWNNSTEIREKLRIEEPEEGSYQYFLKKFDGNIEAAVEAYIDHYLWEVPRIDP